MYNDFETADQNYASNHETVICKNYRIVEMKQQRGLLLGRRGVKLSNFQAIAGQSKLSLNPHQLDQNSCFPVYCKTPLATLIRASLVHV